MVRVREEAFVDCKGLLGGSFPHRRDTFPAIAKANNISVHNEANS
jgi:hypothetical protein